MEAVPNKIDAENWFYLTDDDEQKGPFSLKELKVQYRLKTIHDGIFFWHETECADAWVEVSGITLSSLAR